MTDIKSFILCGAAAVVLAGCSAKDEPDPPVPEPADNSRTVMVYMVADNSLGRYDFDTADLDEMQQAVDEGALGPDGRLIVYHNRVGTASGTPPVMMEILPGERRTLKDYPDDPQIFSTDAGRLAEAVADMKRMAPAAGYGIVFWSHGTAWLEEAGSRGADDVPSPVMTMSFGQDRTSRMKVSTMAEALDGAGLDFVYFDCCLMASVEVAYELRHVAPLIAGSTSELPAEGTNYRLMLPHLFAEGEADVVGAAKSTFDYYDAMTGSSRTCTMSVIRTQPLDRLAEVSRRIMELAPSNGRETYQHFSNGKSYRTLIDMAQFYTTFSGVPAALTDEWTEAFSAVMAYSAATPTAFGGVKVDTHCGLTTLLVADAADTDFMGYRNQAWWRDVVSHNPNLNK